MHHKEHTKAGRAAVEIMEHNFMNSAAGRPYQATYNQLDTQMKALEKQYAEFWAKAEPAFMGYMEEMLAGQSNPR